MKQQILPEIPNREFLLPSEVDASKKIVCIHLDNHFGMLSYNLDRGFYFNNLDTPARAEYPLQPLFFYPTSQAAIRAALDLGATLYTFDTFPEVINWFTGAVAPAKSSCMEAKLPTYSWDKYSFTVYDHELEKIYGPKWMYAKIPTDLYTLHTTFGDKMDEAFSFFHSTGHNYIDVSTDATRLFGEGYKITIRQKYIKEKTP